MEFVSVRVFTKDYSGGNLAAVVMQANGADYTEKMMQEAAALIGYSETIFVKADEKGSYSFRFFTPCKEVEMCGHGAIGSFFVLRNKGMVEDGKIYSVETKEGIIQLVSNGDSVLLEMTSPKLERYLSTEEKKELADIMGLSSKKDQNPKVAIVCCGLSDILLPIASKIELDSLEPNMESLAKFSQQQEVVGVHAYYLDNENKRIYARNFAPFYGINEESATGTSNGGLAFYLWKSGLLKSDVEQVIIQGEAMNQASQIIVKIETSLPRVFVGGTAQIEITDTIEIEE